MVLLRLFLLVPKLIPVYMLASSIINNKKFKSTYSTGTGTHVECRSESKVYIITRTLVCTVLAAKLNYTCNFLKREE